MHLQFKIYCIVIVICCNPYQLPIGIQNLDLFAIINLLGPPPEVTVLVSSIFFTFYSEITLFLSTYITMSSKTYTLYFHINIGQQMRGICLKYYNKLGPVQFFSKRMIYLVYILALLIPIKGIVLRKDYGLNF